MRLRIVVLAALLAGRASPAAAQLTFGDTRAFIALRSSHVGALTPLVTPAMLGRQIEGAQLGLRYGFVEENDIQTHALAFSAIVAAGLQSSVTLSAGVLDADCVGCSPALLLGLGGDMRVMQATDVFGEGSGSALHVGVSGDLGYAQLKPGDDYAIALGVGAPVTLSFGGGAEGGMRFAPYFTPVFGVGQTSTPCPTGCDKSGTRWVLGGGIGVWNPLSTVSASIGINHVMADGAKPVYGVNVVIGSR